MSVGKNAKGKNMERCKETECCKENPMEEAKREIKDCIDGYEEEGYSGLEKVMAVLEYAQWIDKVDYNTAKEILYRFVEDMVHPEWD